MVSLFQLSQRFWVPHVFYDICIICKNRNYWDVPTPSAAVNKLVALDFGTVIKDSPISLTKEKVSFSGKNQKQFPVSFVLSEYRPFEIIPDQAKHKQKSFFWIVSISLFVL